VTTTRATVAEIEIEIETELEQELGRAHFAPLRERLTDLNASDFVTRFRNAHHAGSP